MPLAGHDAGGPEPHEDDPISTPMPLAGHDPEPLGIVTALENFYSHAPRGA